MIGTNNRCKHKEAKLGGPRGRSRIQPGVRRRDVVAMLAAAPFFPAYAAKETGLCENEYGGIDLRREDSGDIAFWWTLRGKTLSMTLRNVDLTHREVKAKFRGYSHEHTTENYFRMIYNDPFKEQLLAPLLEGLVRTAIDERVHPVENIVSFVQSFPHCDMSYQQWPKEALYNQKADCSDKTTLACALIDAISFSGNGDLPYWGMFRLPKIHLTLGLSSEVPGMMVNPEEAEIILERARIKVGIIRKIIHNRDVVIRGMRVHPEEAHAIVDGTKFYFTELNGDPGRLPGQWGSFKLTDWKFIPARRT